MEALKIAVTCVLAAVLYGIIHDQFTARICVEYFTIFHPPIFPTQSPTLLGIGWGILATWWVGVFFAVPMILAARAGSRPALRAADLLPSIACLLVVMAASAALPFYGRLVGTYGFLWHCLCWRSRALCDDLSTTVSASAGANGLRGQWLKWRYYANR